MTKPKILIIGHGRHGKDTVAEMLGLYANMTCTSSSYQAAEVIFPSINAFRAAVPSMAPYETALEAFDDRHSNRMIWKELISLYTAFDKAALAKLVLQQSDIYVGMRCEEEYIASFDLFDHVIWVDASPRLEESDPSMGIPYSNTAMIHIDNSGDLDDLLENVLSLITELGLLDA